MDSSYQEYDHVKSAERIRSILNQADIAYTETESLPSRDKLTFTNGFYARCSAVFIDIRGSSQLPGKYRRPTLARLYRSYLSEVVAILNSTPLCREVNIVGDGAWAVYNTPNQADNDAVFAVAFRLNSMVKVLSYEFGRRRIDPIEVGIGVAEGRALMVKAGYAGSGLNDVVYMGDVVNSAAKLASHGNQTYSDPAIQVDATFYGYLNKHNKDLLRWSSIRQCWQGDVVSITMERWYEDNCR